MSSHKDRQDAIRKVLLKHGVIN